ncbi:hypothetical protein [Cupriavidus basilensis]|uniref:Transcriptional regulator, IclR family n=1 Tax=Cupriavidus basilensis TaxID=68895 RepID=A0A643G4E0_9BURK|nr:hypothetical protein [Cupriavidus basilensis]QOT75144.1 hypothetical protein F7R26_012970 [Cupriavidus basilensis]
MNRREWRNDVHAVAVPLFRPVDSQWLIFNCGVSAQARPFAAREREVAPGLMDLVRNVERLLGMR